jgi:putative alpha-1,2-mannosidase
VYALRLSFLRTCLFPTSCVDDDYAVSVLAALLNKSSDAAFFRNRGVTNPFTIYNHDTGFMEAKNANGSWAGPDAGWTEGDKWAYSFDVVQDIDRLIQVRGGKTRFIESLDTHFDGGRLHSSLDARVEG